MSVSKDAVHAGKARLTQPTGDGSLRQGAVGAPPVRGQGSSHPTVRTDN
jgi:hypothetical protein